MSDKLHDSTPDNAWPVAADDPLAATLEHRTEILQASDLTFALLDLAENAKTAANKLKKDFPSVVFTSGRRSVSEQARAMATNILTNRKWIEQTYAKSAESEALQKWVDDNSNATTQTSIEAGLAQIMNEWTDAQRVKLSRHFAGLAFDVRPTEDSKLIDAIKALPNLVKFLESEGGIRIWHAEFSAA